jgi:DNA-binding Xre family transcriptional regulator
MGIDHSMYRTQFPDLVGNFMQGMNMRDMMDQKKLQKEQLAEEQGIKQAFGAGMKQGPDGKMQFDQQATLGQLAQINPQKAFEFQEKMKSQQMQDEQERLKKQLQEVDISSRLLGSVSDQQTYDKALMTAKRMGLDVDELPRAYDPGFVRSAQLQGLTAKEQLAHRMSELGLGASMQKDQANLDLKRQQLGATMQRDQSNLDLKRQELGLREKALNQKAAQSGAQMNIFEKEKVKKLGKDAAEWSSKDRNIFQDNLQQTQVAMKTLEEAMKSGNSLFGPAKGNVPDFIRAFTNENALKTRDAMHKAIQDTLRPTLGAQFTEKEGERIMNLSVNPRLSDQENYRRAKALNDAIQKRIDATDALYSYMMENGTDRGFPYEQFDMEPVGGDWKTKKGSFKPQSRGFQPGQRQQQAIPAQPMPDISPEMRRGALEELARRRQMAGQQGGR